MAFGIQIGRPGRTSPLRQALTYSLLDGVLASAAFGIVNTFRVPFLESLKATAFQVSLLASVPGVLSALVQLGAPAAVRRTESRKLVCILSVFVQSLWLVPMVLAAYAPHTARVPLVILFFSLYSVAGAFSLGPWAAWMGELLPGRIRSQYFGWRNRVQGLVSMLSIYVAGRALHVLHRDSAIGFVLIFIFSGVLRGASGLALVKQYEPPMANGETCCRVNLWSFLRGKADKNLLIFTIHVSLITFATWVAAPFFALYMRRDLQFSYLQYTNLALVAGVSHLIFVHFWGYVSARTGSIFVLRVCTPPIVFLPIMWAFLPRYELLILNQFVGSLFWSGQILAVWNFVLDASPESERVSYSAYFNVISGLALSAGSFLGGVIIPHLPALGGSQMKSLFLASSLLRFIAAATTLPFIVEVREVPGLRRGELVDSFPGARVIARLGRWTVRLLARH